MSTGITRFSGITSRAGTLVTAILVVTGAAILRGGAAAADSNQDDQFLALLDQEGIPALEGVPSLIDTAHKVCRAVDAGFSADTVVNAMMDYAYSHDPVERQFAPGRLARTEARFITAAVEAYCPYDRGKIASLMASPAADWTQPTHQGAASVRNAVNSAGALLEPPPAFDTMKMPARWQESTGTGGLGLPGSMNGDVLVASRSGGDPSDFHAHRTALGSGIGAVPSGDITKPNPPEIPPPPPPVAHLRTPPLQIATPPRPQQPAPRPQQPAPAPEQPAPAPEQPAPAPEVPAPAPEPTPEQPAPPPPPPPPPPPQQSPGFVRLAP